MKNWLISIVTISVCVTGNAFADDGNHFNFPFGLQVTDTPMSILGSEEDVLTDCKEPTSLGLIECILPRQKYFINTQNFKSDIVVATFGLSKSVEKLNLISVTIAMHNIKNCEDMLSARNTIEELIKTKYKITIKKHGSHYNSNNCEDYFTKSTFLLQFSKNRKWVITTDTTEDQTNYVVYIKYSNIFLHDKHFEIFKEETKTKNKEALEKL